MSQSHPSPWMPTIDCKACTGCQQCVDTCPVDALVQIDGKAALHYPDRCTYCLACEDVCPVDAIELPFLIMRKGDRGDIS